jgi:C-terminal processing protease CtpA/Prc
VAPRAGTDPATNHSYPDIAGTVLDENNFLRSWSNDTYLWYSEITDQDPAGFNDPLNYFDQLRTLATTGSGAPKDKFHFTYDSMDWFNLSQGGVSAGYGAEWAVISATPPREIVVAYTEPNTPATNVQLTRGATVLEVDGVDINTNTQAGVNALNDGLFPSALGETHIFTVRDLDGTVRPISMISEEISNAMVQATQVINTPTGDIGYMVFNYHRAPAEEELVDAINTLNAGQGIDDLVLDIRYNGGGFLAIASQLAYMIAGPGQTAGKTFEEIQFNDKHRVTDPVTGQSLAPTPFYSTTLGFSLPQNQALPTLNLSRVFVLTGPGTCSASEAVMNGLRGAGVQIIQIGATTCGKPYGFYPTDNCGTTYFTIQFRGVNESNFGDYSDGFVPSAVDDGLSNILGCGVADDYTKLLGDPEENRLEVALAYQAGQICAAPAASAPGVFSKSDVSSGAADGVVYRSPFDSNRILRR